MMKKGIAKFTAFCLAAGLTFSGTGIVSLAAGADTSLVGIGSTGSVKKTVAASGETAAQTIEAVEETAEAQETYAEEVYTEAVEETEVETEAPLDTSMVNTTGFAKCNEYVNIRATGDTEGEVLGKLYNNAAVYILGVDEHGWYKVRSGNVEGYVASQYIATGAAAETLSSEVGYNVAEVGAEVLNVRASASTDSEVVAVVSESEEIEVVEDCGEWLKVAVDADTYGYVSVDYVNAETQYKVAESIEEEQARLAEEQAAAEAAWLAYLAEQEAAQAQAEAEWLAYVNQQNAAAQTTTTTTTTTTTDASGAQAEADALYQEYLDAQAEADAATQQADEQLVYDTAAAAQEAYQEYLTAQNAADQAAVAQTTTTTETTTQDTTTDATADYTEDTYTEDTYVEDTYVEDTYVEDTSSEEEYVEDASTATTSSLGQEIASFACQFVGNPYVWGGTSLTSGADCSGFTQSVMSHFGISIPRTAASQSGSGTSVSLSDIQAGDLLFYSDGGSIGHVSIYIGNGQVVHASNPTNGIIISSYSYRTPVSARRYW